ncbi:hypothetical protein NEUTE1DRAFT_100295 [Neurospora tetrasperma FGSC 2508]|uniref:Uncharacterized protein n=1 Tax=Neurospora tetrasperma (strain FGSC 2508 / ATCC MYA-4615 / P0657) TaxID=510951 RepID=F8MK79_NEUT8|nr:uncharacterized protein NEUTE1DRAFT_100295 [Neurospora tetrasperma FGSC 2508]EGO57363.1 hypothetical protein NEUTE1DRAFT_100295 [Neurospora tetrasperma FGSC 2508]EGZ72384.1 hypothetical protein NEUTE2DRAFT_129748 [Neurospora tetrasperma FGSC 2509]
MTEWCCLFSIDWEYLKRSENSQEQMRSQTSLHIHLVRNRLVSDKEASCQEWWDEWGW